MDADILVAGAGCAGLSLATYLVEVGADDLEVLLLDARETHTRDRTWCYWSLLDHPFEAASRHAWQRWRVVTPDGETECGSPTLAYHCLPADAFYRMALERLEGRSNVRLLRGVSVEGFEEAGGRVVARTSRGDLAGRLGFDSRPVGPAGARRRHGSLRAGEIDWAQHFVGLEVETERPVFDPSVATLMDFRPGASRGIRFMYVLPFDPHRALLEDTWFGGEPLPETAYVEAIGEYLGQYLRAGEWRELHRERGVIPMRTLPPPIPPTGRVTNIGVRAGLARPATGYAFLAIQRQALRLATWLERYGTSRQVPRRRAYPRATAFLDRVFLSYLEREPEAAPGLFLRLFSSVPPDRMARFLFDGGTATDRMAVMRALPATPLLREALRRLGPILRDAARRT